MKAHEFGRTFKVSPHATPTANKFGRSTQCFKCQPEIVVLDALMTGRFPPSRSGRLLG